jgi:hypothetical protein
MHPLGDLPELVDRHGQPPDIELFDVAKCVAHDQPQRPIIGVVGDESGIVYTRTGRRFFGECLMEEAMLARVRADRKRFKMLQQRNAQQAASTGVSP